MSARTEIPFSPLKICIALMVALALLSAPKVHAQQPADLQDYTEVTPSEPTVIDGVWRLQELNRRILIEQGHAIAMDEWTHAFLWQVQRGMVTSTDIRQTGPGAFAAYDALLRRPMFWKLQKDGTIRASGKGWLAPTFTLLPIEPSHPRAFEEELATMDDPARARPLPAPGPAPAPPSAPENAGRADPIAIDLAMTYPVETSEGLCLQQPASDVGIQGGSLEVAACEADARQRFIYLSGDGLIVTAGGTCLETEGTAVRSYGCDKNPLQVWTFKETTAPQADAQSPAGRFKNGQGQCLAVSETDGATLLVSPCSEAASQLWILPQ